MRGPSDQLGRRSAPPGCEKHRLSSAASRADRSEAESGEGSVEQGEDLADAVDECDDGEEQGDGVAQAHVAGVERQGRSDPGARHDAEREEEREPPVDVAQYRVRDRAGNREERLRTRARSRSTA